MLSSDSDTGGSCSRSRFEDFGLDINEDGSASLGRSSPFHPRNWPSSRKIYDTGVLTVFIAVSAMLGNVGSSVVPYAQDNLQVDSVVATVAFASMFFFGQATGGILLPPYTEAFGRRTANIVACIAYAAASALAGLRTSIAGAFVGRFCCGFLSALPTVVGAGSIEDMWDVRERVWAIDIWIKASIVGIALGPAFATYVSTIESLHWAWVFYLGSLMLTLVCLGFCFTQESRPNVILHHQLEKLRKTTGIHELKCEEHSNTVPSLRTFTTTMLFRPTRLFLTEPIIATVTIMSATVFGSVYLQTEGLHVTYTEFGFSDRKASLVYIAWIVGLFLTVPLRAIDYRIVSRRIKSKVFVRPEDKMTGFYVAAPCLAGALWWFSWTTPPYLAHISPLVSMGSVALIGACLNEFDGTLQGYLTDSYTDYAASALAPLAFIRGVLSGVFPIFARQMFSGLGSNVSGSVLAALATVYCFIAVWFWRSAVRIREASPWATCTARF